MTDQPVTGEPRWLDWSRRLHAVAQAGLHFGDDAYDHARYEQIREIVAEIASAGADAEPDELIALLDSDEGYVTPKVDVRGVVFDGGRILLVRERADERWTVPGGFADVDDLPSRAVAREVAEEAGYVVRATKLLAVLDRSLRGHPPGTFRVYKLFFRCEVDGQTPRHELETDDVGLFDPDDLPPLSLGRTTPGEIDLLVAHERDPDRPTDFD